MRMSLGITQKELAERAGLSQGFMSDIEKSDNLRYQTLEKIARALGMDVAGLLTARIPGEMPVVRNEKAARAIALVAKVPAGGPEAIPRETILDWLTVPGITDPNAFAIRVEGNSMEPTFRHDDIVIISPAVLPSKGDAVLAVHMDGTAVVKRYYVRGDEIILTSDNPDYEPIIWKRSEMRFLGKVVKKFQETS